MMGWITAVVVATALAAPPPTLDEIAALARGGAPGIALNLLDTYQATPDLATADWIAAERERIHILAAAAEWRALSERVAALPDTLPPPFADWAAVRHADALLQLGDGAAARNILRRLIWITTNADDDSLRMWRMLVIRAFLIDDERDAALIALRRYTQDYGTDDPALRGLHAEVLLAAGRPDAALEVLGDMDEPLRWLAELGARPAAAAVVFERSVRIGSARETPGPTRRAAWGVAAQAARQMRNYGAVVATLERALQTDAGNDVVPDLLQTKPAELWDAYRVWGQALGNASHLMIGVDDGWMAAATAIAGREPAQARALLARLAHDTTDAPTAHDAHASFAALLHAEPGGPQVLAALYLRGGLYPEPGAIPAPVRYLVADEAVRDGDLVLAAALLTDLDATPAEADPMEWQLRRARVLVLGGGREAGPAALSAFMDAHQAFDADRVLQVLFDLQATDAHAEVLPLFDRLYAHDGNPPQLRREILYWMADSFRALDDHTASARFYLRSAQLLDPYSMDQWAQTARYQAAGALERAGLYSDAASVLQSLLNATQEPGRRTQLQRRIDELPRHPADSRR